MNRKTMNIVRGISIGVLAGAAVSAMGMKMMKSNKRFRRGANKAFQAVTDVIDDVGDMMH